MLSRVPVPEPAIASLDIGRALLLLQPPPVRHSFWCALGARLEKVLVGDQKREPIDGLGRGITLLLLGRRHGLLELARSVLRFVRDHLPVLGLFLELARSVLRFVRDPLPVLGLLLVFLLRNIFEFSRCRGHLLLRPRNRLEDGERVENCVFDVLGHRPSLRERKAPTPLSLLCP